MALENFKAEIRGGRIRRLREGLQVKHSPASVDSGKLLDNHTLPWPEELMLLFTPPLSSLYPLLKWKNIFDVIGISSIALISRIWRLSVLLFADVILNWLLQVKPSMIDGNQLL